MQRNNLKIKYNANIGKWQVISPDKVVLEEFASDTKAIKWASDTKDYLKRKT